MRFMRQDNRTYNTSKLNGYNKNIMKRKGKKKILRQDKQKCLKKCVTPEPPQVQIKSNVLVTYTWLADVNASVAESSSAAQVQSPDELRWSEHGSSSDPVGKTGWNDTISVGLQVFDMRQYCFSQYSGDDSMKLSTPQ